MRAYMIDFREQYIRNQEKAAAAAAAAQAAKSQQKSNTTNLITNRLQVGIHSLPNGTTSRTGTLYESRSSISSPYGSGSSLNRTSSLRRASLRDREKVKKLNESFLDVLQAKDNIQEDVDENPPNPIITNGTTSSKTINKEEQSTSTTSTDSTIREPTTTTTTTATASTIKKSINPSVVELTLPPLKVSPPLLPPQTRTTADTLSDVKRRREERRRGVGGPLSSNILPPPTITSPPSSTIDMNHNNNTKMSNGNHLLTMNDSIPDYSAEKYIELHGHINDYDREKRICCTIL
jgi:hypothetical protein